MRQPIVQLLRCPSCQHGRLAPESDAAELYFGPLHCSECQASFPVAEGVADLLPRDRPPVRGLQRGLESAWVARSYERYLRPAVTMLVSGHRVDRESEYLLYRSLLGSPEAPVLDLGCGTGMFARRLAREPRMPPVVAMDASSAMLEEAVAQAREHSAPVDFLRAEAPRLPFQDGSLGAVLQAGSLHFFEDLTELLSEVRRVLEPGGRFVATSYLPPSFPGSLVHRKAGLFPRGEDELRFALAAAGLGNFERMRMPPFILVKGERS